MFPIRFDFPFRKANGDLSTIGAEISAGGGGGGGYTLPTASAETKGGIKIGAGLSMEGETLNNTNPTSYTLPTASAETLGGVKIGEGITIDENGAISASGGGGGGSIPFTDLTKNTFNNQFIDSADKTLTGDALVTFYNSATGSADYRMISINGNSSYGTLQPKGVLTLILPKNTTINATSWVGKGKDVLCTFSYFN